MNALEWNVCVPSSVKVSVEDGRLRLTGSVKWGFQKDSAISAVRHLIGVRSILNLIQVEPDPNPRDIKERIEKALARSAADDARNIRVSFEAGKVVLEGKVHSRSEIIDAKWAAFSAPGVQEVDDRLSLL